MRRALAYRSAKLALALSVGLLCCGCSVLNGPVLDPKGPIALAERDLMLDAIMIMMVVIIPAFLLTALFIWRYRGTNRVYR